MSTWWWLASGETKKEIKEHLQNTQIVRHYGGKKHGRQVRETPGKYLSPALNVGQLDFCSGIYR